MTREQLHHAWSDENLKRFVAALGDRQIELFGCRQ
jgi:hypothetical protein